MCLLAGAPVHMSCTENNYKYSPWPLGSSSAWRDSGFAGCGLCEDCSKAAVGHLLLNSARLLEQRALAPAGELVALQAPNADVLLFLLTCIFFIKWVVLVHQKYASFFDFLNVIFTDNTGHVYIILVQYTCQSLAHIWWGCRNLSQQRLKHQFIVFMRGQ